MSKKHNGDIGKLMTFLQMRCCFPFLKEKVLLLIQRRKPKPNQTPPLPCYRETHQYEKLLHQRKWTFSAWNQHRELIHTINPGQLLQSQSLCSSNSYTEILTRCVAVLITPLQELVSKPLCLWYSSTEAQKTQHRTLCLPPLAFRRGSSDAFIGGSQLPSTQLS